MIVADRESAQRTLAAFAAAVPMSGTLVFVDPADKGENDEFITPGLCNAVNSVIHLGGDRHQRSLWAGLAHELGHREQSRVLCHVLIWVRNLAILGAFGAFDLALFLPQWWVVALAVARVCAVVCAVAWLAERAVMRSQEYDADAYAVRLLNSVGAPGKAWVLESFEGMPRLRGEWVRSLVGTHPPLRRRLARIRSQHH